MGGKKTETQTTTQKPLQEVYDILKSTGWPEIERMYATPQEYFPGDTIAGRDPLTAMTNQMTQDLFTGPGTTAEAAKAFHGDVLGGKFMGGPGQNPMLDDRFADMSRRIEENYKRIIGPQTMSRYAAAGRTGSDAYNSAINQDQANLARGLGETATSVYYQDYENRMRDRMNAMAMSPMIQGLDITGLNQLRGVGSMNEGYAQQQINDQIARWEFGQQEPEMRLDRLLARLGQTTAGYGTTTQRISRPDNTGLSIGMGLLGMAGTLGGAALMGPMGASLGGMLGGGGGASLAGGLGGGSTLNQAAMAAIPIPQLKY